MANASNNSKLIPVLVISTNETGSHRTVYPNGTRALDLVHDYDSDTGLPTYAEGVYVDLVPEALAQEVRRAGKRHFSSTEEYDAWIAGEI